MSLNHCSKSWIHKLLLKVKSLLQGMKSKCCSKSWAQIATQSWVQITTQSHEFKLLLSHEFKLLLKVMSSNQCSKSFQIATQSHEFKSLLSHEFKSMFKIISNCYSKSWIQIPAQSHEFKSHLVLFINVKLRWTEAPVKKISVNLTFFPFHMRFIKPIQ